MLARQKWDIAYSVGVFTRGQQVAHPTTAETKQKADYPILLANKNQSYLLWNLVQEGLQVIPLK